MKHFSFKGFLEDAPLWEKCIILLFFIFTFSIISAFIGNLIMLLFEIENETDSLKVMQLFSASGAFVAAPLAAAYLFNRHTAATIPFHSAGWKVPLLACISMVVAIPLINVIGAWNAQLHLPEALATIEDWMQNMEDENAELSLQFLDVNTVGGLLMNLAVLVFLPAFGEEMLFRGVIQRTLTRHWNNPHLAIWCSAFIFSAIHLQFFGFFPRFLIGAFFGYLLYWSNSLWPSIAAHSCNNGLIVILYFCLGGQSEETQAVENIGVEQPISITIVFALLFAMIAFKIHASTQKKIGK